MGLYQKMSWAIQAGYQNASGVLRGPVEVGFQHDTYFNMSYLRLALNRWDLYGGLTYLYSNSRLVNYPQEKRAGFGDPFFGFAHYILYENYFYPQMSVEAELMAPWGDSYFSTKTYLGRSRLLFAKGFSFFRLSFSLGILDDVERLFSNKTIFLSSANVFLPVSTSVGLGVYSNYQSRTLLLSQPLWQLGGFFGFLVYSWQGQVFFGKELTQTQEGWFFGIGLSHEIYEGNS